MQFGRVFLKDKAILLFHDVLSQQEAYWQFLLISNLNKYKKIKTPVVSGSAIEINSGGNTSGMPPTRVDTICNLRMFMVKLIYNAKFIISLILQFDNMYYFTSILLNKKKKCKNNFL